MKLELKHLAPYLPHGLKMLNEKSGTIIHVNGLSYSEDTGNITILGNGDKYYSLEIWRGLKPILLPLSDLGKQAPRTVSGVRNVDEINKTCMYDMDKNGELYDLPEAMDITDLWDSFEGLFKYHFDLFGLIDAGLAIDINSLKQ